MANSIYFSVDAKTILQLGRDSIKDATTALLELVKNSYDADATNVDIQIHIDPDTKNGYIRIADNGEGMNLGDIIQKWLRIGFSEKSTIQKSKFGRRKTGEKGIGRISADRLGSILKLTTIKAKDSVAGIKVNWDDFNVEGADLSSIPIEIIKDPKFSLPNMSQQGTELVIEQLRQPWSEVDIENLYQELSVITPPFKETKNDFTINLTHNLSNSHKGEVKSPFYSLAEITLEASYTPQDNIVHYSIKDMYGNEKKKEVSWTNLSQRIFDPTYGHKPSNLDCGPVNLTFLFYSRESRFLKDTEFNLTDLRQFLDKNVGVKIYRDNIRVLPYGSSMSEGDWLGISERKTRDPAALNRRNWHVSAGQLVGGIFIGRDENLGLTDSSGREGDRYPI